MRFRTVLASIVAVSAIGCSGDRATGPADEAARAADDLERAAGQLDLTADPSAALTYQSVATALRGGARVSHVDIDVDGDRQSWYAFAHEIVLLPAASGSPIDFGGGEPLRALLAWRSSGTKVQVIHLMAMGDAGDIGGFGTIDEGGDSFALPSSLLYSEGRNLYWDAVSGHQTSHASGGTTPCPGPRRAPAGPLPSAQCVLATFRFSFSGVSAEPFTFPFGPSISSPAGSARRLAMGEQQVEGMQVTLDLRQVGIASLVGQRAP